MKIYAFHLLNDYSGSPKVLMQLTNGWIKNDLDVTLVTCKGREGFLSNIRGAKYIEYWYRFAANPIVRLFNLTISQVIIFIKLLRVVEKDDIVYINTVLPFGAAFLGKARGCRVIYHVHETSVKPALLKRFLFGVMRWAASDIIYVSDYLAKQEHIENKRIHILPNAIENEFLNAARTFNRDTSPPTNVLMVCSLKPYKGIFEFISLATENPTFQFKLVANASKSQVDLFVQDHPLPANLEIIAVQSYLHPFYNWAHVIVNLSRPDEWIETFGLTIIEGMAHSLPAIVPPVGGIAALVEDGVNGYHVDSRDALTLSAKLHCICTPDIHQAMSENARERIDSFNETTLISSSLEIIGIPKVGVGFHHMEHADERCP